MSDRHDRGWPKVQLLTWTTKSDQTWRFHIQAMGKRDNWDARGGWLEIIQWLPRRTDDDHCGPKVDSRAHR